MGVVGTLAKGDCYVFALNGDACGRLDEVLEDVLGFGSGAVGLIRAPGTWYEPLPIKESFRVQFTLRATVGDSALESVPPRILRSTQPKH